MKFNIDIKSNFKYQTKNWEVKFDIRTNEIRQDSKKICIDGFDCLGIIRMKSEGFNDNQPWEYTWLLLRYVHVFWEETWYTNWMSCP